MPTYEYKCESCGHRFEKFQSIKAGIKPQDHEPFEEYIENLVRDMSDLNHLRLEGLMTMGPRLGDPEAARPYFRRTRRVFERIRDLSLPNVDMKYLSMGMTNSYGIAYRGGFQYD